MYKQMTNIQTMILDVDDIGETITTALKHGVKCELIDEVGPAGGASVVKYFGTDAQLRSLLVNERYCDVSGCDARIYGN
jgi:hypothetical protein